MRIAGKLLIVGLGLVTPALSKAQTSPSQEPSSATLSPAMKKDIDAAAQYPLAADFLPRATQTLQAIQAANIRPPNSTNLSLQDSIQQISSIPGLAPILRAHGFTPESFMMSMTAFGMTLAATNGQTLPPGMPQPNPANVALFHAHPEQVTALMQVMGTPPGSGQSN